MPEHPAIVAGVSPAELGGAALQGAPGRPRRRRYFTGDARRPWRVCRFPRPVNGEDSDPAYCRCGGAIDRTAGSRSGWRHQPTRARVAIAAAAEPVR